MPRFAALCALPACRPVVVARPLDASHRNDATRAWWLVEPSRRRTMQEGHRVLFVSKAETCYMFHAHMRVTCSSPVPLGLDPGASV